MSWKLAQDAEADEWAKAYQRTGYVWTYEDGTPLLPQYASRLFDKLLARANERIAKENEERKAKGEQPIPELPQMTFHGQRHESASLMIASGEDLAVVSKLLGHANYSVTSDMYTHMLTSAARSASEKATALVPRQTQSAHNVIIRPE